MQPGGTENVTPVTDAALQVLVFAQQEAVLLDHNYLGTEHLLLGLLHEDQSVAWSALTNLGVQLTAVRASVESMIGRGDKPVSGQIGLSPHARRVMELTLDESQRTRSAKIGTEHLLLGLIRETDGIAVLILSKLGVAPDALRAEVMALSPENP